MSDLIVKKIKPFNTDFSVPGDKSISHRSILISSLSNGICNIKNFLFSEDCISTISAMKSLGITINFYYLDDLGNKIYLDNLDTNKNKVIIEVHGNNRKLIGSSGKIRTKINCGNSGTTIRLLSGILAAQNFSSYLYGDESLSSRPMNRIVDPLKKMGADISTSKSGTSPLTIKGKELHSIDYEMPVSSAQVKSAIMLAAIYAEGNTKIKELHPTRNHTENMFSIFGVKTIVNGNRITIFGNQVPRASDIFVPGDISSAAFWICLAVCLPGTKLTIHDVGLNESRTAFLKVLIRMGASISEIENHKYSENYGKIEINNESNKFNLKGTVIEGKEIANLIDELPILAIVATLAEGKTVIKDASELRVKETDRISTVVTNLRLMGAKVDEFHDGFEIHQSKLNGTTLNSYGDHRIAMAFAIAGLLAKGTTRITNFECVNISYPGFENTIKELMNNYSAK